MDDDTFDTHPAMDELDQLWIGGFIGQDKSIPPDAIVDGFIAIISWIDSDGERKWRHYNTIDAPLSNILGLLECTKHTLLVNNTVIE